MDQKKDTVFCLPHGGHWGVVEDKFQDSIIWGRVTFISEDHSILVLTDWNGQDTIWIREVVTLFRSELKAAEFFMWKKSFREKYGTYNDGGRGI